MPDQRTKKQIVWHGSPALFNQFSCEKILTGEGANVYGHGIYFTETREVADYYQRNLSNRDSGNYANSHLNAKNQVAKFGNDPEWAIEALQHVLLGVAEEDPNHQRLLETIRVIQSGEYLDNLANNGYLYQVEIPHAERFLDWDKPLYLQSEYIRNALKDDKLFNKFDQYRITYNEEGEFWFIADLDGVQSAASNTYSTRTEALEGLSECYGGQGLYEQIAYNFGSMSRASEYLNSLGVSGLRYFDQKSQMSNFHTDEKTFNFVVFSDQDIRIIGIECSDGKSVFVPSISKLEHLEPPSFG